jgi:Opioid growth factor receptor (OGFr) conserved region
MTAIADFYRGDRTDYLGRSLENIWRWDNHRLEQTHNYIQVLFPNREPSHFNLNAPLLDQATIDAFRQDEKLRSNLAASLDVMLRFYGLEYQPGTGRVVKRPNFAERGNNWLTPYNHNYLRITRILKCLVALGLPDRARAFFACLQELYSEHGDDIGLETFGFWKSAIT